MPSTELLDPGLNVSEQIGNSDDRRSPDNFIVQVCPVTVRQSVPQGDRFAQIGDSSERRVIMLADAGGGNAYVDQRLFYGKPKPEIRRIVFECVIKGSANDELRVCLYLL